MYATPLVQLFREFAICVSLSFIIVLGIIHCLLHLLHAAVTSGLALRSPALAKFLPSSAVQTAQHISHIHAHLFVIFKITVASSVLVFALREIGAAVAGWWGVAMDSLDENDDLEVGNRKPAVREPSSTPLRMDEKKRWVVAVSFVTLLTSCCSSHRHLGGIPYPNNTVIF